jgi:hypothetical protein
MSRKRLVMKPITIISKISVGFSGIVGDGTLYFTIAHFVC